MSTNDRPEPFGPMLTRTSRAVRNLLQKLFSQAGHEITVEQWVILANLQLRQDGQIHQQLAERTYKDKAAITRLVTGLEERGLITRRVGSDDHRQKRIFITRRGAHIVGELLPLAAKAQQQAQQGIDPADFAVFSSVLRTIFNNATVSE
jgi:DNA-binding MarR family transcriptional regulator